MGMNTMRHSSNGQCGCAPSPSPSACPSTRAYSEDRFNPDEYESEKTLGEIWGTPPRREIGTPDWSLLAVEVFSGGFAIKAKYAEATNYGGVKIMVYRGEYDTAFVGDPHFCESRPSPIARFVPTDEGWQMAISLARSLWF